MLKTDDQLAQDFLNDARKWQVSLNFHQKLHVMLFRAKNETVKQQAREVFIENPHIERALLERKFIAFNGFNEDQIVLRRICYGLARLWEYPFDALDKMDQAVRTHWENIIRWLSTYGGEIPNLPGAIRYVFDEEPRIDHEPKFPPSFPVLDIKDVVTYPLSAREKAEQRAYEKRLQRQQTQSLS